MRHWVDNLRRIGNPPGPEQEISSGRPLESWPTTPAGLLDDGWPLSPLRAEFVLIDLDCRATVIPAHHSSPRHQFQRYLAIELRRPTDGELQIPARIQDVVRSEQHAMAAHVDSLA